MEKSFDRAIWEFLEPISKTVEGLISIIENNVGGVGGSEFCHSKTESGISRYHSCLSERSRRTR